jgi:hypothetical protein
MAGEMTPPDARLSEDTRLRPEIARTTHPDIVKIHPDIARIHPEIEKNHRGAHTREHLLTGREALMLETPTRREIGDARQ